MAGKNLLYLSSTRCVYEKRSSTNVPLIELNLRSTFINRFKDKKDTVNFELCMESYQQRNALNCISLNLKFVRKPCYKLLFITWIFRLINLYKPCGTAVLTFRKFHSVENWYKFLPARESWYKYYQYLIFVKHTHEVKFHVENWYKFLPAR